ncbi:MAG: hypothetical protein C0505_10980 [Leptothrix sp. (in: Bacteria)]|nr:hypothetical protein [Leptothrix sp. (in: b-proteobacteria)]
MPVHERLLRTDPEYRRLRIVSENHHFEFRMRRGMAARTGITRIPVVVHVVHRTAAQNISDAQVQSQIDVLNRDFRKTNGDLSRIPAPFKPLAADARIEFVLADKDPSGNPSTGITRTSTTQNGFVDDDKVKRASTGGADAWPRDKYLNVWVCQLNGGLLGYAQFPGGGAATDGVVVTHTAFGTTGTAAAPFNLGRTATHEIGHWLNLRHIWGDDGNGCNGDDFVPDTPNQGNENVGKPAFPQISCNNGPNGDMFMNYMDYVDDDSMFMFSAGQVERMQACLDGDRASLGSQVAATSPVLDTTPSTDQLTIKFRDDVPPTLKFREDNPPTIKFRDDVPPTLKFREDNPPTLKFRDDVPPTLKFREDNPPTSKFRDDVKQPVYDKPPQTDVATGFGNDAPPIGPGPFVNPGLWGRGGVPFVLSTPHHSMAWTQSFPQTAELEMQALAQQIGELQSLLTQYAQGDAAAQLGDEDRAQADAMNEELEALMAEYQRYQCP